MIQALDKIQVITLFVEDLPTVKAFYLRVFGLEVVFEDAVSAVLELPPLLLNLLQISEAPTLVEPTLVGSARAGARAMLTIAVEDTNAVCAELAKHDIALLNGPTDRSWGRRTAAFADPAGNVWEIAQELR